eukprot:11555855-Prorocentrum_lima.AAC.1
MTSSLVGSEMCIRDSSRPRFEREFDDKWPRSDTESENPRPYSSNRREESCLLYTSDAADDM